MTSFFKKIARTSLLIFWGGVQACANDGRHALIVYNVAAMTLTKLTVSNTLEQCNKTMESFKAQYPNEARFIFSCVSLANGTE